MGLKSSLFQTDARSKVDLNGSSIWPRLKGCRLAPAGAGVEVARSVNMPDWWGEGPGGAVQRGGFVDRSAT